MLNMLTKQVKKEKRIEARGVGIVDIRPANEIITSEANPDVLMQWFIYYAVASPAGTIVKFVEPNALAVGWRNGGNFQYLKNYKRDHLFMLLFLSMNMFTRAIRVYIFFPGSWPTIDLHNFRK